MWFTQVCILFCLLAMFYQDLKYRAISWFIFPSLALSITLFLINKEIPFLTIAENFIINNLLLILQLGILTVLFSFREKRWVNITNGYLGWGDILFFAAISPYFSPVSFVAFYCVSLLITLVITIPFFIKTPQTFKIPLAGLQAITLTVLLTVNWFIYSISMPSLNLLMN